MVIALLILITVLLVLILNSLGLDINDKLQNIKWGLSCLNNDNIVKGLEKTEYILERRLEKIESILESRLQNIEYILERKSFEK